MGSWPLELAWLHEPLGPKWNSSYKQKTGQIHCTSRFGLTILLGKSVFGEIAIPIGSQVWVAQQSAMQRYRRLYIVSGYCSYSLWFWKSTTYEPCEVSFHFGNCVSSRFLYFPRMYDNFVTLCPFIAHACSYKLSNLHKFGGRIQETRMIRSIEIPWIPWILWNPWISYLDSMPVESCWCLVDLKLRQSVVFWDQGLSHFLHSALELEWCPADIEIRRI